MHNIALLVLCVLMGLFGVSVSAADEQERDNCTCKNVDAGASSTLKGGVCTRTEKTHCLMEWDAGSTNHVNVGNGLSQSEAAERVDAVLTKALNGQYRLSSEARDNRMSSSAVFAAKILFTNPPEKYGGQDIAESFVLIAGTALVRFDEIKPDDFIENLARNREQLIPILKQGGSFSLENFAISGVPGCLKIIKDQVRIFVKTPFADDREC